KVSTGGSASSEQVLARLNASERAYVEGVMSLSDTQLAAAYGRSPVAPTTAPAIRIGSTRRAIRSALGPSRHRLRSAPATSARTAPQRCLQRLATRSFLRGRSQRHPPVPS